MTISYRPTNLLRLRESLVLSCIVSMFGCLLLTCQFSGIANAAVYVPAELNAPYTLAFTAVIIKPTQYWLTEIGQRNVQQVGHITVSCDGRRFLYSAKFGTWRSIAICDTSNDTAYIYDSSTRFAVISSGAGSALVSMRLLPMPGIGYDFYPMFKTFSFSASGPSQATMAVPGAVSGESTNEIQGMAYIATNVKLMLYNGRLVPSRCDISMAGLPLTLETCSFSEYELMGPIELARITDVMSNVAVGVRVVSKTIKINGSTSVSQTMVGWPPKAVRPDGHIEYFLTAASQTALPDQQYQLETYLPTGCAVSDTRASH